MKKMMCGALCAALLTCSVGAAAADSYTVTVDGTALDLSGKTPFVSQEKVMAGGRGAGLHRHLDGGGCPAGGD
ncbi:hypothetical protein [Pseudoflavonifractor sp.]|uniref:hypothetical protein n=1 Tax=Pseudoflavonifractor sp. TaxID=1980281 RepID=UPI003D93C01E